MLFGGQTDEAEAVKIIDRALDAGINFLDTANIYNRGRSEEIVGRALKRNGRRARVVLAMKVHGVMDEHDPNAWGNSRRHILEQCEASLRRLRTDVIDLYQVHRPMSTIPIAGTLRALDDLVRSGKVRYLGTSTFAAWQLVEALWVSKELGRRGRPTHGGGPGAAGCGDPARAGDRLVPRGGFWPAPLPLVGRLATGDGPLCRERLASMALAPWHKHFG
jgi:aryl-alcohol dehydrogenase-like predicted oxidoreductase